MQTSGELRSLLQALQCLTASTLRTVQDTPIHTSFLATNTSHLSTCTRASYSPTQLSRSTMLQISNPHLSRAHLTGRNLSSSSSTSCSASTTAPTSSSSTASSASSSSPTASISGSQNPSRFSWDEVRRTLSDLRTALFPISPAEEEAARRARMGPPPLAHALRAQQHSPIASSSQGWGRSSKSIAFKAAPAADIRAMQSGGSYPTPEAYKKPEVLGILATEFDRKDSHFHELKTKRGENFMGKLFKWGLVVLSFPVALWVLGGALMNAVCVAGMQERKTALLVNKTEADILLTLQRVRDYIRFTPLAIQFEGYDGTFHLVQLIKENQTPAVMKSVVLAMEHLFQFEVTMNGMLQTKVVERLEEAFAKGWFPSEIMQQAQSVYLDLHAARRTNMQIAMMAGKEKEKKKLYKQMLKANLLDANSLKPRPRPEPVAADETAVQVDVRPVVQVA